MTLFNDLLFALRTWRRNPIPPLTAALTLALGVGANTAIFSVVHKVMLKPLPYPDPGRLVQIWSLDHRDKDLLSTENLESLRTASRAFQDIGYYRPWMSNLSAPGPAAGSSARLAKQPIKMAVLRPHCAAHLPWWSHHALEPVDGFSYDRGIGMQTTAPECVAQNDDAVLAGSHIAGIERTTHRRRYA